MPNPDVVTHGQISTIQLHASDPDGDPLTFTTKWHDPLVDLQTQYGLNTPDVEGYFNFRGQNEKYLHSSNGSNAAGGGWYLLMPDGNLRAWNGSIAASNSVAIVPVTVYDNPVLLTSTTGDPLVSGSNPLYDLKMKFGLGAQKFWMNPKSVVSSSGTSPERVRVSPS